MKRLSYILLSGLMLILSACEKDTESANFAPVVTTGTASNIYRMGATLSGSITLTETNTAQSYGILLSSFESMAEATEYPVKDGSSNYNVLVQGLESGETYYYCAYASSGYSTAKSQIKSFTTTNSNAPVFNELILWSKDKNSCKVSVDIIDDGGSDVNMSGFVWKESGFGDPTIYDSSVNVSVQGGSLSTTITGLEPNKIYVVRAYAQNAIGVSYSNSVVVPTSEATVPYLSNVARIDSTTTSIAVKAHIIDAGSSAATKIGFCYSSENTEPTTNHKVIDLTEQIREPEFWTSIGDLETGTTYYIRAFAENEEGTGYSEVLAYTPKKEEFGAVDLGLSVLWANFNLGATSPEEYGDYYAFGEISPKATYTEANWIKPGVLYLPAEKDAATQQLGEDWRMPTKAEVTELLTECSWELITIGEQYAYRVTGKTGKSIVLPITGEYLSELQYANYEARYRTSEAYSDGSVDGVNNPSTVVLELQLNFADTEVDSDDGWSGHPIRAVKGERKQEEPSGEVIEKSIKLTEAGTLANILTEAEQKNIWKLTVSGPINGDDLYLIDNMARNYSLTDLDMSKASIVQGGGTYSYAYDTQDNIIGDGVLADTKLKKLLLPNGLMEIGNDAFRDCRKLTEIIIPDAVIMIRDRAFQGCVSLTNATIGKSVLTIGEHAFTDCSSLSEVTCNAETPPNIYHAFFGIASPATLYVPAGCYGAYINSRWAEFFTTITDGVSNPEIAVTLTEAGTLARYITDENKYYITKLKVTGPLNGDDIRLIREMSDDEWYDGNKGCLSYLDLSEARIVSGGGAYYTDDYDSYSYTTYDNEIGEYMFRGCKYLETVLLPKDIEWIGKYAFHDCSALKDLDLPDGITSVEESTFGSCVSLTNIILPDGIISIKNDAFRNCSSLVNINIPDGVTLIGESAYSGCSSLISVKIPDSVVSMEGFVFYACSSLSDVTIGNGIDRLSYCLFESCSSLKSIVIPNNITAIDPYAFRHCSSLESVTIGNGVVSISSEVFANCTSLKNINIPDSVEELGSSSFSGCTSLESAILGEGLMWISSNLFDGCSALKEVTINNSKIYSIGNKAFYRCALLTNINIPASVESIGSEAFYYCRALAEVTCGAATPPALEGTEVFTRIASPATLIVPSGSATAYNASDWAQYFTTIEETTR